MATIQAKRFKDALKKIQRVGRIEEAFTIAGCEVVLQNLSPHEYETALQAIEGLEDVAYAFAYQVEQVARGVVEIDGQDLRDVEFIEDEVPTGQFILELQLPNKAVADSVVEKLRELKLNAVVTQVADGGAKTIKVERHQWLKENVLKNWSREALTVAWRKFTEVAIKSDEVAKEGVKFSIPDETAEDKYRRLLNELQEAEEELPNEMIDRILDDSGLMKKSRREELDAANEQLTQMRQQAPQPVVEAAPEQPNEARQPALPAATEAAQQAMAARRPLNRQGADIPIPSPPTEQTSVPAKQAAKVPDQIRRAAMQNTQGLGAPQAQHLPPAVPQVVRGPAQQQEGGGINTRRQSRASEIAALEAQMDPGVVEEAGIPGDLPLPEPVPAPAAAPFRPDVAELSHRNQGGEVVDTTGVRTILDRPPVVGVNRHFKPRGT